MKGLLGDNKIYWIWLAQACGPASKSFLRLIERYEDPFEIYSLDEEQIEYIEGIGEALKRKLSDKTIEEAYSIAKFCKANKIDIICYDDKKYPARLRLLDDPPAVLFCRGKLPDIDSRVCIAMVGTRKMSEYGKASAYKIAYELASANAVVVSGMALGIDGVSAAGALGADGDTVAVLGCGIDVVYPKKHDILYQRIVKRGAVISEFMPSTPPNKYNFPIRNRIISALCQGTLVVEGDRRSGSLITAKFALEQGRDVFALPGNVGESNSEGPNALIQDGASVALCAEDILQKYDFLYGDSIDYKALKKEQRSSRSLLDEEYLSELGVCSATYAVEKSTVILADEDKNTVKVNTADKKETNNVSESKAPAAPTSELDGLDELTKRIFEQMPTDSPVSPDRLVVEGSDIGDVITSLTMLELCGLVSSLPGGLYVRK